MAMEIVVGDRTSVIVEKGQKAVFGRGNAYTTDDRTVSRRHVSFVSENNQTKPCVSFEVLGKNPMWTRSEKDGEVRVFRRSEKGEVAADDWFCVSGKKPVWFRVGKVGVDERENRVLESELELAEGSGSGSELESLDVSGIDPVKELGFVVMGHEFDHCPKQMIRDVKKWNWFLEEPGKEGDDDDGFERKERRGVRRKRGKGEENEDDEWTGESEADEEAVAKLRKVNTPKYSTRSKARNKPQKDTKRGKCSAHKKTPGVDEEGMEDEDDETLGGFIVAEEDMEEDELEETEDEEEFVEDDDEEE
ncbi:hypothetical protein ACFX2I_046432 [Malus domestica]